MRPGVGIHFYSDQAGRPLPASLSTAEVHQFNVPGGRFNLWERAYLPIAARASDCDLLHCASSGSPGWSPLPILLTVHDVIPLRFDDGHSDADKTAFRVRLTNALRHASRIIAVSHYTRDDLHREYPRLATPVEVVHWGCDMPRDVPQRTRTIEGTYLLAFGGEAKRKNTLYTVERFCAVAKALPALKLVLVGVNSARQREVIAARARSAGLLDRTVMLGFVSEQELGSLYSHASAVLYFSLYEGFGLPLLEAIAHGAPVVASDRTSLPEVLSGVRGCFDLEMTAQIDDVVMRLASDSAYRAGWIGEQKQVLGRFDWRNTATKTLQQMDLARA